MTHPISTVTVIVPCFNEASRLPTLLERLRAMRAASAARDWRFLFIDDGSTDRTFAELLCGVRDTRWMEVVRHHEHLGVGAALRTGLARAASPIVCTIDGSCTYPPERLPDLTALIEQGADVVTAAEPWPDGPPREGSRLRLLLSRPVASLYRQLTQQDPHAFTCLFRAYRRTALEAIRFRSNGIAAVGEIWLKALSQGYRVATVPMRAASMQHRDAPLPLTDALFTHAHLITLATLAAGARHARQTLGR